MPAGPAHVQDHRGQITNVRQFESDAAVALEQVGMAWAGRINLRHVEDKLPIREIAGIAEPKLPKLLKLTIREIIEMAEIANQSEPLPSLQEITKRT